MHNYVTLIIKRKTWSIEKSKIELITKQYIREAALFKKQNLQISSYKLI